MTKAKINPEFTYKTRDGQEVSNVHIIPGNAHYPVSATVNGKEKTYTAQGYLYSDGSHPLDLIKQPEKKTKPSKEIEAVTKDIQAITEVVPHKHHDLIVAWAKNPKLEVQVRSVASAEWEYTMYPKWVEEYQYRIKPQEHKLITIIGSDGKSRSYPEPCRVKPTVNQMYFTPYIESGNDLSGDWTFCEDYIDEGYFTKGLMHLTKEAAELHAKAMLGID